MTRDVAIGIVKNRIMIADPMLDMDAITLSDNLMGDLGFDSLDIVELCVNIEMYLHKDLPEDKSMNFKTVTVETLVDLVEKL